jgi:hypothetical protein
VLTSTRDRDMMSMNPCYEISPTRNLPIGKFSTLPAAPYPSIICAQLLTVNSVSSTGNGTCVNRVVYCATGTEIYISAG